MVGFLFPEGLPDKRVRVTKVAHVHVELQCCTRFVDCFHPVCFQSLATMKVGSTLHRSGVPSTARRPSGAMHQGTHHDIPFVEGAIAQEAKPWSLFVLAFGRYSPVRGLVSVFGHFQNALLLQHPHFYRYATFELQRS
jgi:hypothetical protein